MSKSFPALLAVAGFLVASPLAAQQVVCGGTSSEVCVLSEFTLTNGGSTFNWYAFNGATTTSKNTESTITTLVANLPGGVTGSLSSATFFDGGVGTALTLPTDWDDGTGGGQFENVSLGTVAGGSSGFSTCAGPFASSNNPTWSTCDRPGTTAFGSNWDYMLFSYALSGALTEQQLSEVAWGWKAQSIGPNGNSIECGSAGGVLKHGDKSDHLCGVDGFGGPQEATVPEPATMTLLATGLVGLAASTRRRKKNRS